MYLTSFCENFFSIHQFILVVVIFKASPFPLHLLKAIKEIFLSYSKYLPILFLPFPLLVFLYYFIHELWALCIIQDLPKPHSLPHEVAIPIKPRKCPTFLTWSSFACYGKLFKAWAWLVRINHCFLHPPVRAVAK